MRSQANADAFMDAIASSVGHRSIRGVAPAVEGELLDHAWSGSEHFVAALLFDR